jgi:nucleoside-diphosphate-sugar epimerase
LGGAIARRLVDDAWDVTVVSRQSRHAPEGCRHVAINARDADGLAGIIGSDTDLLLSCVAFDSADAECLAQAGRRAGRIIAISSASVYRDGGGRTLDEAAECGFPEFPVPLTEQSPTVQPGPETYSTRKLAMEQTLLDRSSCPVTVLRPCAIHGPKSKHAREWWFVKRLLDGRTTIPLAYRGRSRFQTTSVFAIADAVVQANAGQLPAIVNISDADSPHVAEIGRVIIEVMGVKAELVGLPDAPAYPPGYGATPWSIPRSMVCASAATTRFTYAQSVAPAISWLVDVVASGDWTKQLPQLAGYQRNHFDYETDDIGLRLPGASLLT